MHAPRCWDGLVEPHPAQLSMMSSPKIGVGFYPPKWMVKIMENPIKMDDLGGPSLFLETPTCREMIKQYKTRWWQLKYFLFSPRSLGKCSNLTCAYFSNGWEKPPTSGAFSKLGVKSPQWLTNQNRTWVSLHWTYWQL